MKKEENLYCSENGIKQYYSKNGTIQKHEQGITLVALVVTIIVLLILAGITLNLIAGSNGILARARNAARMAKIARYSDSKELSDAGVYTDMLTTDTGYTNLYQYLKEKCKENETGDPMFRGDHGTYWVDDDGNLHYKDDVTGMDGTVIKGNQGELVLKEIVTKDGTVKDMTTEDSLRKEIETAMKDLKDEYERSGDTGSFKDFIDKKLEENGGKIKNPDTGGTIKPNGDGTYTYEDMIIPPNTGKITIDGEGNVTITDIKINKTSEDDEGSGKTEKDLLEELEKAIQEQKEKQKEEGDTGKFKDYLDKELEDNGGKIPTPITGGSIEKNDDDTYTYEDSEIPSNKVIFDIDDEGNITIIKTEMNPTDKTEKDLREELEKAIQEQKEKQKEEGDTGKFKDYLDKKLEDNGGKIPTPITGGTISKNDDGTYTYEDSEVPSNKIIFDIDDEGNIIIIKTEMNPEEPQKLPSINLSEGNVEFEYSTTKWTNENVIVKAKPKIDTTGYIIETSRNGIIWNKADSQTFMENGTFYVRLFNGQKYGAVATANITNIDKTSPIITEVTATTYSITMKATDEASGIIKYAVTENEEMPTAFESCDNTKEFQQTITGRQQGKTYYVWVKDEAGNISEGKTITLGTVNALKQGDLTINYTTTEWTNENVTATITPNVDITGFTIQVSTDGENWSDLVDSKYTFEENGTIFVALRDPEGQLGATTASVVIKNIDKTLPVVTAIFNVTTRSFEFTATDDASGLNGYVITETADRPDKNSFTAIEGEAKTFTTKIDGKIQNKTYYVWVKDVAENISEARTAVLKEIDTATSNNLKAASTTWNGTNATVRLSTTTSFQIQYCTTQSTNNSDWITGNSVTVPSGTTIYARLWDGVNAGTAYLAHTPVLTYQVQYNANGGTGTMANSTHLYGTAKALTANAFSKTGYTFAGWATSASGAVAYTNGQSVNNLTTTNGATVNLYAKWTANTNTPYKVVHQLMNVYGNGYYTQETENKTGTSDANVTPGVKSYTGFTSPSTQTVKIAANGTTTVTYSYTRNKYRFTLGSGTGVSTSGSSGTGDYYYGGTITLKAAASTGYTWNQWTSSNTGLVGNKTTANTTFTMPAGAVTMTPSATLNSWTVSYHANGGSGAPGSQTKYYGQTLTLSSTKPTRSGYTFLGWSTSSTATTASYSAGGAYTSNAGATLYAVWKVEPAISVIKGSDYGGMVRYNMNGYSNWNIFSNDGGHIYIITSSCVLPSSLSFSKDTLADGRGVRCEGTTSDPLVEWLLDSSYWESFVDARYADNAQGGPTLAQLAVSANGKLGTDYDGDSIRNQTLGYNLYGAQRNWWLANQVSFWKNEAWSVQYNSGKVSSNSAINTTGTGVRPIVRLKSNVKMTWDGSGWNLSI